MKSNITLIGMPGAGKSTVGIILAKKIGLCFMDTDVLIQIGQQKPLQQIINESGHLNLRAIEEETILKIGIEHHVIATGGSVVYSDKAMTYLQSMSKIVFLEVDFEELKRRIKNFETRGIAKSGQQTFADLYDERKILYKQYADLTLDCNLLTQEELADQIVNLID